ncbi:MAG: glycosyltransferase family 2 protein [Pirellulaceae bacterium]|nr:glycosyltransferase family 2 protein [Pirellulaceae bacterium]
MSKEIELSFVIPVYNGSQTVGNVVRKIQELTADLSVEVILVNDGSADTSEKTCAELCEEFPTGVHFVHLARNFGEHNAVLAGLHQTRGDYVAVLDDDGQHPPEEVLRMYEEIKRTGRDVIYGRYTVKHHSWFRNLGSWFTDRMANIMLKKPPELYLSSFKVMNRFVVNEITAYRGPFPYIDGLIYRTTHNLGQIDVQHQDREAGQSGYTVRKLVGLWLNMFLNFSIKPLRIAVLFGCFLSLVSVLLIIMTIVDKIWITQDLTVGIPTVLVCVIFFAGVQMLMLGCMGEYLGRMFLDNSGTPQFVVRYVKRGSADPCTTRTED